MSKKREHWKEKSFKKKPENFNLKITPNIPHPKDILYTLQHRPGLVLHLKTRPHKPNLSNDLRHLHKRMMPQRFH